MNAPYGRGKTESLKNVIIVVLVIITILLLYFFGTDTKFSDIGPDMSIRNIIDINVDQEKYMPQTGDVVLPSRLVLGTTDGASGVTEAYIKEPWGNMLALVREFCSSPGVVASEITKEQYDDVLTWRSLMAEFDYYVPFAAWCDEAGITRVSGSDALNAVSAIGFSEGSPESLFIADNTNGKYFRFVSADTGVDFGPLMNELDSQDSPEYYRPDVVFGEDTSGNALVPLSLTADLAEFTCYQEFSADEKEKYTAMAKTFFGDSLDFVRKIEEADGTVTYMYGYGKRVLIAGSDGTYEYKEEAGNARGTQYFDALKTALAFASRHGGAETQSGQVLDLYLTEARQTESWSGGSGYRFTFGITAAGRAVEYGAGAPLTMEVYGDTVTYFKRGYYTFDEEEATAQPRPAEPAVDILTKNYERISAFLWAAGGARPEVLPPDIISDGAVIDPETVNGADESGFSEVINALEEVSYGYLVTDNEQDEDCKAVPVWFFRFTGGVTAAFDLYTGEFAGMSGEVI